MGTDRGCVSRISEDGKNREFIAKTGRPNGLAIDKAGNIFVAESKTPSLMLVRVDGKQETLFTACEGQPFLFPNDLCFGPDGALYMTDSGIHLEEMMVDGEVRSNFKSLHTDGRVYRIDLPNLKITKLDNCLRFANGIAFGPDRCLYVTESQTGIVYRYAWFERGHIGERQEFCYVIDDLSPNAFKAPDGIAFGSDGMLYVTVYGQGDVTVLSPAGDVGGRLKTAGRCPTNVAFGHPSEPRIFVTEVEFGRIEVFPVASKGLPLFS
jgi:gluconolactonase